MFSDILDCDYSLPDMMTKKIHSSNVGISNPAITDGSSHTHDLHQYLFIGIFANPDPPHYGVAGLNTGCGLSFGSVISGKGSGS